MLRFNTDMRLYGISVSPVVRASEIGNNLAKKSGAGKYSYFTKYAARKSEVVQTESFAKIFEKTLEAFKQK